MSLERLKNADILDQDHKKLYERLSLSVNDIPTTDPRIAFFTFAAFPEDSKVWVYEDFFPLWTKERIVGNRLYDSFTGGSLTLYRRGFHAERNYVS